jgi:predicted component of type VI protein secretion system
MPAQLLALTDGPSILLDKPILLLGRHGECDVQLNSRKVSRRHCCIAQVHDYLVVRDLGSTNGIRINGHRVIEGRLSAGDELTVGNFRYQVYLDGPAFGESSGPPPLPKKAATPDRLEEADEPVPLDDATANVAGPILAAKPAPVVRSGKEESFVLPEKLRNPPPPAE